MKNELIVRISEEDFSTFAGYYYTDSNYSKNNEVLNEYITLYRTTPAIKYLHIECEHDLSIHTIAYICNQIGEKYFIKTDFAGEGDPKKNKYWLCFYKEQKEDGIR